MAATGVAGDDDGSLPAPPTAPSSDSGAAPPWTGLGSAAQELGVALTHAEVDGLSLAWGNPTVREEAATANVVSALAGRLDATAQLNVVLALRNMPVAPRGWLGVGALEACWGGATHPDELLGAGEASATLAHALAMQGALRDDVAPLAALKRPPGGACRHPILRSCPFCWHTV